MLQFCVACCCNCCLSTAAAAAPAVAFTCRCCSCHFETAAAAPTFPRLPLLKRWSLTAAVAAEMAYQQQGQQNQVRIFQAVTGCRSYADASDFLHKFNYNLSLALDTFYSLSPSDQAAAIDYRLQQQEQQQRCTRSTSSAAMSSNNRRASNNLYTQRGGRGSGCNRTAASRQSEATAAAEERQLALAATFAAYATDLQRQQQQEEEQQQQQQHQQGATSVQQLQQQRAEGAAQRGKGVIDVAGLLRLSRDLGVPLDDVFFLIFAFLCECEVQGTITREEFFRGMKRAAATTVDDLRSCVAPLRTKLATDRSFARSVYAFAFKYSLDAGQKTMPIELCRAYWELLLPPSAFPLMLLWLRFIEEEVLPRSSALSRDSWVMIFDFMQQHQQQSSQQQQCQPSQNDQLVGEQQQERRQPGGSTKRAETGSAQEQQQEQSDSTKSDEQQRERHHQQQAEKGGNVAGFADTLAAAAAVLQDYDEDGAWPLVIDEFVEWLRRLYKKEKAP